MSDVNKKIDALLKANKKPKPTPEGKGGAGPTILVHAKPMINVKGGNGKDQKIKTGTDLILPNKPDGRTKNGGKGDVGRKPGGQSLARRTLRAILANHYAEPVIIELKDSLTGKPIKVAKPRVLAMMEKMYEIAVEKGDSNAGDRWLNRALGKAPQPMIGDEEEDPIRVDLGVGRILDKVYNDENDDENEEE